MKFSQLCQSRLNPQLETLEAECEFHVPTQFMNKLDAQIESQVLWSSNLKSDKFNFLEFFNLVQHGSLPVGARPEKPLFEGEETRLKILQSHDDVTRFPNQ
jgi:hypothetical protein